MYVCIFVFLCFITTVVGPKSREMEMHVNTFHMYSLYGLSILKYKGIK